jgi:hypothetical protein
MVVILLAGAENYLGYEYVEHIFIPHAGIPPTQADLDTLP